VLTATPHVTTNVQFSTPTIIPISIGFNSGTFTFSAPDRFLTPHNSYTRTLPRTRFYLAGRGKDQSGDKAAYIGERTKEGMTAAAAGAAWLDHHNAVYAAGRGAREEQARAREEKRAAGLARAAAGGGGGDGGGGGGAAGAKGASKR
jgi:hypothetical protein